ncbi:hypothetical protein PMIN07_011821 [Paraphaeosphaeria minitans]
MKVSAPFLVLGAAATVSSCPSYADGRYPRRCYADLARPTGQGLQPLIRVAMTMAPPLRKVEPAQLDHYADKLSEADFAPNYLFDKLEALHVHLQAKHDQNPEEEEPGALGKLREILHEGRSISDSLSEALSFPFDRFSEEDVIDLEPKKKIGHTRPVVEHEQPRIEKRNEGAWPSQMSSCFQREIMCYYRIDYRHCMGQCRPFR